MTIAETRTNRALQEWIRDATYLGVSTDGTTRDLCMRIQAERSRMLNRLRQRIGWVASATSPLPLLSGRQEVTNTKRTRATTERQALKKEKGPNESKKEKKKKPPPTIKRKKKNKVTRKRRELKLSVKSRGVKENQPRPVYIIDFSVPATFASYSHKKNIRSYPVSKQEKKTRNK